MTSLVSRLAKVVRKEIAIWSITQQDMKRINEAIMSLPLEGVEPRVAVYNMHLQDVLWTFWFGEPLHKEEACYDSRNT